jgi:hypothetical protein
MLPKDHFVTRFLNFTTAGVTCCVAAVKSCPVFKFSELFPDFSTEKALKFSPLTAPNSEHLRLDISCVLLSNRPLQYDKQDQQGTAAFNERDPHTTKSLFK